MGNYGRLLSGEFAPGSERPQRLVEDARVLKDLVFSLYQTPEFDSTADQAVADLFAQDFIDLGNDRVTPEQYVQDLYVLSGNNTGDA